MHIDKTRTSHAHHILDNKRQNASLFPPMINLGNTLTIPSVTEIDADTQ